MSALYKRTTASPVGALTLTVSNHGVCRLEFGKTTLQNDMHLFLDQAEEELIEYFTNKRERFDVPLDMGGPRRLMDVLCAVHNIPFGDTRTYQEVAEQTGNSLACRAVGRLVGMNAVPILVPATACWRKAGWVDSRAD